MHQLHLTRSPIAPRFFGRRSEHRAARPVHSPPPASPQEAPAQPYTAGSPFAPPNAPR